MKRVDGMHAMERPRKTIAPLPEGVKVLVEWKDRLDRLSGRRCRLRAGHMGYEAVGVIARPRIVSNVARHD